MLVVYTLSNSKIAFRKILVRCRTLLFKMFCNNGKFCSIPKSIQKQDIKSGLR